MTPVDRHNRLAPEIVRRIVEGSTEQDAYVLVESVVLGVLLYYHLKHGREGVKAPSEFLDVITARVIERMAE